jgi:uncharacterized protein
MSLYSASVPVFVQMLRALENVLRKAEAHAEAKKISPEVMLGLRLTPDMFALARQVQVSCDFAKNTAGRLAGVELPKLPDDEKTFAELYERISKTLAFIESLSMTAFEGAQTRPVEFPVAGKPYTMAGGEYFYGFAMPNFYFHVSAAYMILRDNGVVLNKRDFLGTVPGLQLA